MSSIALRPATEADYDFLYHLSSVTMREYVEAEWGWDDDWQEARFRSTFRPSRWQVVVVDGEDAGAFALDDSPGGRFLSNVYILPQYQGRGIGTLLLTRLMGDAFGRGMSVTLSVLKVNERARRLYERLGFSVCGEEDYKLWMRAGPPTETGSRK